MWRYCLKGWKQTHLFDIPTSLQSYGYPVPLETKGTFFWDSHSGDSREMHIFIPFLHSAFISSHATKQTPRAVSLPIVWVQASMKMIFCVVAFSLRMSFFHSCVLFLWNLNEHFGWSWQYYIWEVKCPWVLPLPMQNVLVGLWDRKHSKR